VIFAFVLNIVFNHWGSGSGRASAVQFAVGERATVSAGVAESLAR
jgi:hypothetical protein